MALPSLDNVTATVGAHSTVVSITIGERGLEVGRFGTLPWAGSALEAAVAADGCRIVMTPAQGASTRYFVPVESFAELGGSRAMKAFVQWLFRSASAAGARTDQPAA